MDQYSDQSGSSKLRRLLPKPADASPSPSSEPVLGSTTPRPGVQSKDSDPPEFRGEVCPTSLPKSPNNELDYQAPIDEPIDLPPPTAEFHSLLLSNQFGNEPGSIAYLTGTNLILLPTCTKTLACLDLLNNYRYHVVCPNITLAEMKSQLAPGGNVGFTIEDPVDAEKDLIVVEEEGVRMCVSDGRNAERLFFGVCKGLDALLVVGRRKWLFDRWEERKGVGGRVGLVGL